jgi:hypothetical protein
MNRRKWTHNFTNTFAVPAQRCDSRRNTQPESLKVMGVPLHFVSVKLVAAVCAVNDRGTSMAVMLDLQQTVIRTDGRHTPAVAHPWSSFQTFALRVTNNSSEEKANETWTARLVV